jgi:heterodisulfide reductase subunit A/quinone-modifying oxidoreductase subunit QmoB
MAEQAKIGVYFWDQGSRLSQALDLEALQAQLSKAKTVAHAGTLTDPLSAASLASVGEAVQAGEIDRVLYVGPFTIHQRKTLTESLAEAGLNPYLVEFADLEIQGVFDTSIAPEIRRNKAAVYLKMILARVRLLEPLEPVELPAAEKVLVVGAGVAGLHAADSMAKLGKEVILLEQQSGVGGKVAHLSRFYPLLCDPRCGLQFVLDSLGESRCLDLRTLSSLESLDGCPGDFEVVIKTRPRYVSLTRCNACGMCQEACPVTLDDAVSIHRDAPVDEELPEIQEEVPEEVVEAAGEDVLSPGLPPPVIPRELGGTERPARFRRKAIHPATPMAWPAAFVVEREHCPPDCRECEKACPNDAVLLDQEESSETQHVGAVLLTTGWDPYPLSRLEEYGYGHAENVISNLEMERMLSADNDYFERVSGFSPEGLKEVGFIQCAGSRDEEHLPYCSSVCCSATLKQVLDLKRQAPDAACYVFYQHIRSPGFDEDMYRKVRELGDVFFIRERPAKALMAEDGKIEVEALDPLLDKKVKAKLDLLVLAGGMRPSDGGLELGYTLKMPRNQYDFFESHRQCYPAESQRTGIYVGGCAREPMNVANSIESSNRAAMEALGFIGKNIVIAPTHPEVNERKCDKCGRCVEDCPFRSYDYNDQGFPKLNLTKCRQCGNCMGVCPKGAISLHHRTLKQYATQVETLGDSSSFMGKKEEPVVLAFLCINDAYWAARDAVEKGISPPNAVIMPVPCAGAVNNALVADALSFGVDGVLIGGCKDSQCHYIRGGQLVQKRRGDVADKLQKMHMDAERFRYENIGIRESGKYAEVLNEMVSQLKEMGPNPFKI